MNTQHLSWVEVPLVLIFLQDVFCDGLDADDFNSQHPTPIQAPPTPTTPQHNPELSVYTEDQFIPPPQWSPVHTPLVFNSTEELIHFRERLTQVNNQLINITYNSANSLIRLYNDYKKVEFTNDRDLGRFYKNYQPLVHEDHLNCVGLTIALRKRCVSELRRDFPDVDKHFFYSAGEMKLADNNDLLTGDSLRGDEKWKHVALALHFTLGDRPGYFFIDQAFAVPVVTLMKDREHPHESIFSVPYKYNKDEFHYSLTENGFINFTRYCIDFLSTESRQATGAFYLKQAHDSILNITEKRALIKTRRSITLRLPNMKRPIDIDFLLGNGTFVEIFNMGKYFPQYLASRIDLSKLNLTDPDGLDIELRLKVGRWSHELGFPMYGLLHIIGNMSRIAKDRHFLHQLRYLNHLINNHTMKHLNSAEYDDPDLTNGHDVLYDTFVQYIHSLSSREVFDMWKTHREMNPNKDGRTAIKFPWTDDPTYCCPCANSSRRQYNESEQFVTKNFLDLYSIPNFDKDI